jgi:tetratricopeptide (TPR) repeat protein
MVDRRKRLPRAKMYKIRIKWWKLEKKVRLEDALAVWDGAGQSRTGGKAGEEAVILVNGRAIPVAKMEKYTNRKLADVRRDSGHLKTPYAQRAILSRSRGFGTSPRSRVPNALQSPDAMRRLEEIGHVLHNYVSVSLSSGNWIIGSSEYEFHSAKQLGNARSPSQAAHDFSLAFDDGLCLLAMGSRNLVAPAFRDLDRAFSLLQAAIAEEDPLLMVFFLGTLSDCVVLRKRELHAMLLQHALVYSKTALGTGHPIYRLCEVLATATTVSAGDPRGIDEEHERAAAVATLMVEVWSRLACEFALRDRNVAVFVNIHQDLGRLLDSFGLFEREEMLLRRVVDAPDAADMIPRRDLASLRTHLADTLHNKGAYADALEVLGDLCEVDDDNSPKGKDVSGRGVRIVTKALALRIGGRCRYEFGEVDESIRMLWASFRKMEEAFGPNDPQTLEGLEEYTEVSGDPAAQLELERRFAALQT